MANGVHPLNLRTIALFCLLGVATVGRAAPEDGLDLVATDGQRLSALFAVDRVIIENPAFRCITLDVFLADQRRQQSRGLMFVKDLPSDWGMLFRYARPQTIGMWMRNTLISLDMVFWEPDGRVGHIAEATTPGSLKTIRSPGPAVGVLEINAGHAERFGIEVGSRLLAPDLTPN